MRKFAALIATAGVVGGLSFIAAPALADGTLPAGQSLYAISCEDSVDAELYSVDPATAVGTIIGTTTTIPGDCGGPAAYNPVNGKSYYLSWGDEGQLAVVDLTTGVSTAVAGLDVDGQEYPDSLTIGSDGAAYIINNNHLYSVALDSGVTTSIGTMSASCLYGFAQDPTSGIFYAIQCTSGTVYTVDLTDATLTEVGLINDVDSDNDTRQEIYALQIDSSGRWWIESDTGDGDSNIYNLAAPLPTSSSVLSGTFTVSGDAIYTESLLLAPTPAAAPALAATGLDTSADTAIIAGASALLLGGIAALFVSRRRRQA